MAAIILDCGLMRYPNSGLYHYCLNIGLRVNQQLQRSGNAVVKMYVPPAEKDSFGNSSYTIEEKKWHKLWKPFLTDCRVWHAPFQLGRIIPNKKEHPHIKILLTIHDLNSLHEDKPLKDQFKSVARTQSLINKSDAIVCISEFTKSDVLKYCDVGIKPVHVIHNGTHRVNTPGTAPNAISLKKPFLFGMGYVNKKKNYHVLLPLLKQNPELDLVIAGRLDDRDYVNSIEKQAADLAVEDRLHIMGPVSEEDKAWYLSNCHAFVHPSLAEGFGAPVVEAMSFGKPIFLSDKTSLPEIGGEAAFYFSSFEAAHMQFVFKEGMQRFVQHNMAALVTKRGQLFNWEHSAKQYLNIYQTL